MVTRYSIWLLLHGGSYGSIVVRSARRRARATPWPAHGCLAEIELRRPAGEPQDLLMTITAAVLSLTVAALPVRGQQQGHWWGPIFVRL
jgi:hypothetical protein